MFASFIHSCLCASNTNHTTDNCNTTTIAHHTWHFSPTPTPSPPPLPPLLKQEHYNPQALCKKRCSEPQPSANDAVGVANKNIQTFFRPPFPNNNIPYLCLSLPTITWHKPKKKEKKSRYSIPSPVFNLPPMQRSNSRKCNSNTNCRDLPVAHKSSGPLPWKRERLLFAYLARNMHVQSRNFV